MSVMLLLFVTVFLSFVSPSSGAAAYYLNKYVGDGINYVGEDDYNGIWFDSGFGYLKEAYTLETKVGCSYDGSVITTCSGTSVILSLLNMPNITKGTFNNETTSIIINSCGAFELFEEGTFENLTLLHTLEVQRTALNHVPDLSNTVIRRLNLAGNSILMDSATHRGWAMPTTIEYIALMSNQIYWIPTEMVSGPNLRMASFADNRLTELNPNIFGDTSAMVYFGFEANQVSKISKNSLAPIATTNMLHLNLSHNSLTFIQGNAFSQFPNLKILELFENSLSRFQQNLFTDLPELLLLDLHKNNLQTLASKSFENLPKLKELRLHSQKTPMTSISYTAFKDIGDSLIELFVSDNELTTFPHQVLEEGYYPNLETIYADNNLITNMTEYGSEAFGQKQWFQYSRRAALVTPFAAYPNLTTLWLHENSITHVNNTDLCGMAKLDYLDLSHNLIREAYMDVDAFQCLPVLRYLDIGDNLIQYVPDCFKTPTLLPGINTLIMNSNRLTFIESDAFATHTTLRVLNLYTNRILTIENGAFSSSITHLYLGGNDIRFLHEFPFWRMSSVRIIVLNNNEIQYLPDAVFHNCTALRWIYIAGNNIPQLKVTHFQSQPNIWVLEAQNNDIGWIEDGTFSHFSGTTRQTMRHISLQNNNLINVPGGGTFNDLDLSHSLDLSNNRINVLRSYSFQHLSAENILLNDNNIAIVESYAFNDVSMSSFSLANNGLRQLNENSFSSVSVTNNMNLQSTSVTTIPTRAFNSVSADQILFTSSTVDTIEAEAFTSVSVRNLDFSSNNLASLPNAIFGGSSTVSERLIFTSNNIVSMTYSLFNNVDVVEIYFNNNDITDFPLALTVELFSKISLANNNISVIPSGAFTGQTGLTELYLDNNVIDTIPSDIVTGLTALQTLSMSNNELPTLADGMFVNLTSLQNLYLSSNQMTHVFGFGDLPLANIDLGSNSIATITSSAFSSLTALSSLVLGNNPLECTCQLVNTLAAVADEIASGTCSQIANVSGVTFASGSSTLTTYYTGSDVDPINFQCSAENLQATVVSGTEFKLNWTHPQVLYALTNTSSFAGNVTYHVECTGTAAATLTGTVAATLTTKDNSTAEITFNMNVQSGTIYGCTIAMELNNLTSAKSSPVFLTTPDATATPPSAGPNDIILNIKYYDFSKVHADFDDTSYVTVSNPTYVLSAYGPWLAKSATPTADTFSAWYRSESGTNYELSDTIILAEDTATMHTYWSSEFFPVDGSGFQAESQQDCNKTYHNFGFTSAVRTGLIYSGSEVITVAGGEALWLYIHQTMIVQFISTGATSVPCYEVDLSPASSAGGLIYVKTGVLSNGDCTSMVTSTTGISLELEVGIVYHFDLFHAETRTCTSEYLLKVENVEFHQTVSTNFSMSYSFDVDEDAQAGEIIGTVELADAFSVGGYSVDVYAGNEYRRFTLEPSTYTFTPAADVTPTYTNLTDINGNSISFVECTSPSTPFTGVVDATTETFTFSTTSMQVVVKDDLDHENEAGYYLLVTVTDTGKSLLGYFGIRVRVVDLNDNCPTLSPSNTVLTPQPVLRTAEFVSFTSTDADSGENANIHYVVSAVTEDPPVSYDQARDLWDDIYKGYTSLLFTVVAMDNGTIPRGTTATVNITVSNTCVMDVQFGAISYMFYANDTTGQLTYRVPKYWMYEFTCSDYIGFTAGTVLDTMMSASSSFDTIYTSPGRGRIDIPEDTYSQQSGAWVAATQDTLQYHEVDMLVPYRFTQVHIQGRDEADEWVTSFKILYYDDVTSTWLEYSDLGGTNIFAGNADRTSVVSHTLDPVILAQKVRINPQTWNGGNISMRLDYSGCSQEEQLFYDVSCQRCETSYYCEGDGVQHMCGRCENASVTCDRNPVEHSFGLASECTTCPPGWICVNGTATPCDDFYYVECTNTSCPSSCSPCEAGYACHSGIRTICAAGSYSDGTMVVCEPCAQGFYNNQTGQSQCTACPSGYYSNSRMTQCDPCPTDTYSTAGRCESCPSSATCPCISSSPCFSDSLCVNTGSGGHTCTGCPEGFTGTGTSCTDIDECFENNPCFNSRCINTVPGYQCYECPAGYTGTYEDAWAWTFHRRNFEFGNMVISAYENQTCDDVDECATNNGGCDPLMSCVNTVGSFYCGPCASGYIGTNLTGCYSDNFCTSGRHDCSDQADCVYLGPAKYRCVCQPGYGGPGTVCGIDTDMDGFTDYGISCLDWTCARDNCVSIPNSMQFDNDGDNAGDNCDTDDDNDVIFDTDDNCPNNVNNDQLDTDGDGYGDVCDTCPSLANTDQTDTDGDGDGDACDTDDDNDGVLDSSDNCPLMSNAGQSNTADSDSVGDDCDNCIDVNNNAQTDSDNDLVGDACEGTDSDGDGIQDSLDNCPSYMNGDQMDFDTDMMGDICDDDIDSDGVLNDVDNCPYVSNSDQTLAEGKLIGVDCETDSDGDGVSDANDTCPFNAARTETSFKEHFTVDLYPGLTPTAEPVWVVKNNGGEVMQTASTDMPTMLIGKQSYGAIEYQGTWYTTDTTATDYIGCVFGYVNNAKFYLVMWRRTHYNLLDLDQSTYKGGIKGIQLKLVDSTVGPSNSLTQALYHSYDTANRVKMLWQDPDMQSWSTETPYRWYITHLPSTGYINLKIYQGTSLIVDSGALYDMTITGGRLGVFQYGEFPAIFSNLKVYCLEHSNQALYLNGAGEFVTLDDVTTLQMEESFSIELWLLLETGYTTGPYPVICSEESDICLWVENAQLHGRYFDYNVSSSTSLSVNTWYNVIFRHSIEDTTISIYVDGVSSGSTSNVALYNVTAMAATKNLTLYIGKDNSTYLRGTVDEVRFYSVALVTTEITDHIGLTALDRAVLKYYGNLHFRMEDSTSSTSLANSGRLASPSAVRNGGTFVTSYQQGRQYAVVNP